MKGRTSVLDHLPLVDVVLEVADARIPLTGRHSLVRSASPSKPWILVLNKSDLVRDEHLKRWLDWYRRRRETACAVSAKHKAGLKDLVDLAVRSGGGGRVPGALRLMVVGIPNSGKSSLLNALLGKGMARVGARPGVTRGRQWLRRSASGPAGRRVVMEVLDQPGILPGREAVLGRGESEWKLAAVGALPEGEYDAEECAEEVLAHLARFDPGSCREALGLTSEQILERGLGAVAEELGHVLSGGVPDLGRTAAWVLRAYSKGLLGRTALELPPDDESRGPEDA